MAKDTQRDKARATFGKTFFENSKAQANPKNSMAALQARANARPIPTFKVGGVVKKADGGSAGKDFTKPMMEAAARAAKKGTPVMKNGGVTAERLTERVKAGNYKDGGKAEARYGRKMADIEKDFRIAIAKGKDADVAKAKMNQRIADAKDDLAKATKQDRTATKAAEKAAERELTMTRRYGAAKPSESMKDKPIAAPKAMSDAESAAISALKPAAGLTAVSQSQKSKPAAKPAASGRKPASAPPRMQGRVAAAQAAKAPAQQAAPQQAKPQQAPAAKPQQAPVAKAAAPARSPIQQRTDYAARMEARAAEKRKAEAAPTGYNIGAKLANAVGLGSSADARLAQTLRRSAENEARNKARVEKMRAEQAAAEAERIRIGKEKAKAGNPFYQSYANKAQGGMVGKYAAGGAGKVRKGMMKGK